MVDKAHEIPAKSWDEDEDGLALGPVGIAEASETFSLLTGRAPIVLVNDNYSLEGLDGLALTPIPPDELTAVLQGMLANGKALIGLSVTDGNTSHGISPVSETNDRLVYFDPWNAASFLEEDGNIAGVRARREGQGKFSITWGEYERIIVVLKFDVLEGPPAAACLWSIDDFRRTEFWEFFNVRQIGSSKGEAGTRVISLKTGGFQEFVDLEVVTSESRLIQAARVRLARSWINELSPNSFALDILKSLLDAIIPLEMDLGPVGGGMALSDQLVLPFRELPDPEKTKDHFARMPQRLLNPDRRISDQLVLAFWELPDPEKTKDRFAGRTRLASQLLPVLNAYLGKANAGELSMALSDIHAVNDSHGFRLEWRVKSFSDIDEGRDIPDIPSGQSKRASRERRTKSVRRGLPS